jgi:hypothetical protein
MFAPDPKRIGAAPRRACLIEPPPPRPSRLNPPVERPGVVIALACLMLLGFVAWGGPEGVWVRLIAPFDGPPESPGLAQIVARPESLKDYAAEQCAYLRREELRHPSRLAQERRDKACTNATLLRLEAGRKPPPPVLPAQHSTSQQPDLY